jgi:hypothetical protein
MISKADTDDEMKILSRCAAQLQEHFETVRIFATVKTPDGDGLSTRHLTYGKGNYFAQYGQVKQWAIAEER